MPPWHGDGDREVGCRGASPPFPRSSCTLAHTVTQRLQEKPGYFLFLGSSLADEPSGGCFSVKHQQNV